MKLDEVVLPRRLPTSKGREQIPGVDWSHKVEDLGNGRIRVIVYEDDGVTVKEILEGSRENIINILTGGEDDERFHQNQDDFEEMNDDYSSGYEAEPIGHDDDDRLD
jgi:hypothetical protein